MTRKGAASIGALAALAIAASVDPAQASSLDGKSLGAAWALPFVGMLLSIALMPLFAPHAWERHQGAISAFWAALALIPLAASRGIPVALDALAHVALADYIPFLLLLLALFTAAGGIIVRGNINGTPLANVGLLTIGALLASLIGTTGASMVLIRPMLRANDDRKRNAHVFVFFIFLVSNIGGSLTPLGDPPLFLGYLRGVDFFWTTKNLLAETIFVSVGVLAVFFAIDSYLWRRDGEIRPDPTPDNPVRIEGWANVALIGVIIGAILFSGSVDLGAITIMGARVEIASIIRDAILLLVALASLALTPKAARQDNGFSWGPMVEVAKLFAGIFITIIPVLAMLKAGRDGAFAPLVALVTHPDGSPNPAAYFWATGVLSSFLDNAPTYLVFFEIAGGDPQTLMTSGALTLAAISSGAVFMGANSYIGNAPNFMVFAIARAGGVAMPSFFGYMAWSCGILAPIFLLTTWVFF